MPTTLTKSRSKAYIRQAGLCIYCEQPIWLTDVDTFAKTYQISIKQAQCFKCTAEHLEAKQDGGTDVEENIAAACLFCNKKRHQSISPKDPISYKRYVINRCEMGKWNSKIMSR